MIKYLSIHFIHLGKPGKETIEKIVEVKEDEKEESEDKKDECVYNCQQSGGCSVRIVSSGFISGPTLGSCFSESFGGKCSGIPERCDSCSKICEEKQGKQFSLPANEG